jgi:hypothetical protein
MKLAPRPAAITPPAKLFMKSRLEIPLIFFSSDGLFVFGRIVSNPLPF